MIYVVEMYIETDFHLLLVEAADESSAHQLVEEWVTKNFGDDDVSEQEIVAIYAVGMPTAAKPVVPIN